jgi:PAS domain S-box-containing protein
LLRDLPPRARWYILSVIAVGVLAFVVLVPRAHLTWTLLGLTALSAATSAFKIQFQIASGSNMSVSSVVVMAALILSGPHAAMIVAAASGLSQTTIHSQTLALYRTLFNMAVLSLTAQVAGQVFIRLGGTAAAAPMALIAPLAAMALMYFVANTIPIALAIALTTHLRTWRIWKTDFVSNVWSYFLGAVAAAVVIKVAERSGPYLTALLTMPPLYLSWRMYRGGEEKDKRQGAILEAAQDAIVTMDQQLNIREFNPAAEKMFGYDRLDILGRNVELLLPASERAVHLKALNEYLTTGRGPLKGRQLELRGQRANGSDFPLELTVARSAGVMTGFFRDISGRRTLEEQLRQSQKLEAIGRLAGGVAHDFNNILMSIMGAADLMLMQLPQEDTAREEAREIKQSVDRGAALTRQLLAFSRRQATRSRLFALGDVVGGMETMLRRLIGPEIEFEIVCVPQPLTIFADSGYIEQVVLNLVVNARDAMLPKGGRMTVRVDEVELDEAAAAGLLEAKPGTYARLGVTDTGTGIDAATRARLFEPFFTTKEQGKGTGLGLSIVYGIVKQAGGYINVLSEPGRGASFLIYLPIAATPQPSPAPV